MIVGQKRRFSIVETILNTGSGVLLSLCVWLSVVEPFSRAFKWDLNNMLVYQIVAINLLFTFVSIMRGYFWRRVFVRLGNKFKGVG